MKHTIINFRKGTFCILVLLMLPLAIIQSGCEKLVEAEAPNNSLNGLNVYESDATASSVLSGIYIGMSSANFNGGAFGTSAAVTSLSLFPALSSDELILFNMNNSNYRNYYRYELNSYNVVFMDFWSTIYKVVSVTNTAIEGLNKSTGLTPAVKQQLLGEAKFMRAFCYFYLVNLYGDVPLAISSSPETNRLLSRSPKADVYKQIINDLKEAKSLLNDNYVKEDGSLTTERTRPNKYAATALLARVYLYNNEGNFAEAEAQASEVINNATLYKAISLNDVFLKNSQEAIWQLQPVLTNPSNTQEARFFVLPETGPTGSYPVYLSTNIVNSFETGDNRMTSWVGSVTPGSNTFHFPNKYKNTGTSASVTEYSMILRLAEQYLIRAEARAQQNNIAGAQADLNVIRNRAGLGNTIANDKASLLTAIMQERKVELFTEWGHRWFDLKRSGTIETVMTPVAIQKGTTWNNNWQLYPVPLTDLQRDPNLVQNPGYQ